MRTKTSRKNPYIFTHDHKHMAMPSGSVGSMKWMTSSWIWHYWAARKICWRLLNIMRRNMGVRTKPLCCIIRYVCILCNIAVTTLTEIFIFPGLCDILGGLLTNCSFAIFFKLNNMLKVFSNIWNVNFCVVPLYYCMKCCVEKRVLQLTYSTSDDIIHVYCTHLKLLHKLEADI